MVTPKPSKKLLERLGTERVRKLDQRIRRIKHNVDPEHAAAELAALMRQYKLRQWRGITPKGADERANTLLLCSQSYSGGRHWTKAGQHEPWTFGENLLILYTPSLERLLVLRHSTFPTWPEIGLNTGINYMPRHPQGEAGTSTINLEAHVHRLPTKFSLEYAADQRWNHCCGWPSVPDDIAQTAESIALGGSIERMRDAMVGAWRQVHGLARPSWETN